MFCPRNRHTKRGLFYCMQAMAYFCKALKCLGETWIMQNDWMHKFNIVLPSCKDNSNMRQLGNVVVRPCVEIYNDQS